MAKKKGKEKGYLCKIKISAKKKRDIELCAKAKNITMNRFIKDAINQSIIESMPKNKETCDVLRNQLELFNMEEDSKNGIQLNIDL